MTPRSASCANPEAEAIARMVGRRPCLVRRLGVCGPPSRSPIRRAARCQSRHDARCQSRRAAGCCQPTAARAAAGAIRSTRTARRSDAAVHCRSAARAGETRAAERRRPRALAAAGTAASSAGARSSGWPWIAIFAPRWTNSWARPRKRPSLGSEPQLWRAPWSWASCSSAHGRDGTRETAPRRSRGESRASAVNDVHGRRSRGGSGFRGRGSATNCGGSAAGTAKASSPRPVPRRTPAAGAEARGAGAANIRAAAIRASRAASRRNRASRGCRSGDGRRGEHAALEGG